MHFIGLDIHKRTISYSIKDAGGATLDKGTIQATRQKLNGWASTLPTPWKAGMEATLFTGWIYDELIAYGQAVKVAHPAMLRALVAGKHKNDDADASLLADLLRCNLLPECYFAPARQRHLRMVLRYRNLIVRQAVALKNKLNGLLMETGTSYQRNKLYGSDYFSDLYQSLDHVLEPVGQLLQITHSRIIDLQKLQRYLLNQLASLPDLQRRVELLSSIPGVGQVTSLTWALEVGDPHRFSRIDKAVSYCGLCRAQRQSAGVEKRGPISKKRNKHLQHVLVEAAKLAPRWNDLLAHERLKALAKGNRNRATLAVARKMVAVLLAVDKRGTPWTAHPAA